MATPPQFTPTLTKGTYAAPTPNDVRGPCPMLNTLQTTGTFPAMDAMSKAAT